MDRRDWISIEMGLAFALAAVLAISGAQWLVKHDLRELLPTKGITVVISPAK